MHRTDTSVRQERAILAAVLPARPAAPTAQNGQAAPLEELRLLSRTANAIAVDELTQTRDRPDPATLFGRGKLDELAELVRARKAQVVIFDNDLSPAQIRNVEQAVNCKVLDRSELILDIFAGRARTHEAKLQVELAQLEYTYPRLRAMWSHLERITGGNPAGIGTRGPGEKQIEIDRRIVQSRKAELRREIQRIQGRKHREVTDRNTDFFTVGLVGYTNAGKSTLFNTLTGGSAYADDKLFATLDTRTRKWELGGGDEVLLSDTVGFVRNLPHHLVASFRATLEESIHSDLLVIVLDLADPEADQQLNTVQDVLHSIEADKQPQLLVLNKTDLLEDNAEQLIWQQHYPEAVPISATRGVGLDRLVEAVRERQRGGLRELTLRVPISEGRALNMLENRATIHERQYDNTHVTMRLSMGERQLGQLRATGAQFEMLEEAEKRAG